MKNNDAVQLSALTEACSMLIQDTTIMKVSFVKVFFASCQIIVTIVTYKMSINCVQFPMHPQPPF